MDRWLNGLWRHPEFLKLWAGETISLLGSQVTLLALPLTAVLTLHADAAQMGYLTAAETLPFLMVGLFAGVWIDRARRRPIMVAADVGRFALLLGVPLLAVTGHLSMAALYPIAFLVGVLTVFFDVAYMAFLPTLVGREQLVEGNSKLEVSRSGAQIAGPGLAGLLIGLVTAPIAIAADAASFLGSALFLLGIRTPEPAPVHQGARRSVRQDIAEGLRVVLGNPLLRSIAGCTGTSNFFGSASQAIVILYLTRDLGIGPALLGLIYATGNVGYLAGALLSGRVPERIGLGPTIMVSALMFGTTAILVPLAGGPRPLVVAVLITWRVIAGAGNPLYNVNQVSLRQRITPDRLLGRMNASTRFLIWGTMPVGSLLGGWLGTALGLRPTLVVAAVGMTLAVLWVWFSPVRGLREQPPPFEEAAARAAVS